MILDCDPGHDDALAILLAAQHAELLGVTTVSGNAPLSATTRNALLTLQLGAIDVPVHAGAAKPLVGEPSYAPDIHGESGLNGPTLPELTREPVSGDAVGFIVDTVRAIDDVWLVAVGPLTNVALALQAAPDIATKLAGISVMGGSTGPGNRTPTAEFNIWADPEAAKVVFSSGARLVMCGLNLTHQFTLYEPDIAHIRGLGGPVPTFAAEMLDFYGHAYADAFFGRVECPLHDPCAVLAVTHPELLKVTPRHVAVETKGEYTRGMTVVDERGRRARDSALPNAEVAYGIDRDAALELFVQTFALYALIA